ncbi:hypothetical protein [Streptomyces sp. NPDC050264]
MIEDQIDVVQVFPNDDALLRLVTAVLVEMLTNLEVKWRWRLAG